MTVLRFAGVCVLVGALCVGAVGCARTSTPSAVRAAVAKSAQSPSSKPATRTLDVNHSAPTTSTGHGARTFGDAAQAYLNAVAKGDTAGYAAATGSTTSTSALAFLRRELFGSSSPTGTFDLVTTSKQTAGKSIVLKAVAYKFFDRQGTDFPEVPLHPLFILASNNSDRSWFVLDAVPRRREAHDSDFLRNYCFKPVILLYPPRPTHVRVHLDLDGHVTVSDPPYDVASHGWTVVAQPSGQLLDERSGSACSELFWEGETRLIPDFRTGFLVPRAEIRPFLESKLALLGLNRAESAEFVAYWLPRMQEHPYALVHFAGAEYERAARLSVEPRPDVTIRVFMEFQPSDAPVTIESQQLRPTPIRHGFTAVEWGGMEARQLELDGGTPRR